MLRYRYAKDSSKHGYFSRNYCGVTKATYGAEMQGSFGAKVPQHKRTARAIHLITADARYERPRFAAEIRGYLVAQGGGNAMGPVGCSASGASVWKGALLAMKQEDMPYRLLAKAIRKIELSKKNEGTKAAAIEALITEAKQRGLIQ